MLPNTEEYKAKAESIIAGLRDVQASMEPKLEDIKVSIDKDKFQELYKSIEVIFGDMSEHPDDGFITFNMYKECLAIMRAGGKAKAADIIKDIRI